MTPLTISVWYLGSDTTHRGTDTELYATEAQLHQAMRSLIEPTIEGEAGEDAESIREDLAANDVASAFDTWLNSSHCEYSNTFVYGDAEIQIHHPDGKPFTVDWKLLSQQKATLALIETASNPRCIPGVRASLDGIIELLDALEDTFGPRSAELRSASGCPTNCDHTPEEHAAFDAGVSAGTNGQAESDCPLSFTDGLKQAWLTGHSVGVVNRSA